MKRKDLIIPWLLLLVFLSVSVAEEKGTEKKIVHDAVESIDNCYHWAEENGGGGGEERNRDIEEGFQRDCPQARQKAAEAYKLFPKNPKLAISILKLNDIGYFKLSEEEKKELCEHHATIARRNFLKSKSQDGYFRAFCPEQAIKVYGK